MATYDGTFDTMHTTLTNLLMEHGASVSKKSIDELIRFIGKRDEMTIRRVIGDAERVLKQLQADTRVTDMEASDV